MAHRPKSRSVKPVAAGADPKLLQAALEAAARRYLTLPNLVGIGFGTKYRSGQPTAEISIVFYVTRKFKNRAEILLAGSDELPDTIDLLGQSYPTDVVVERWRIAAAASPLARRRCDPVTPGVSVGGPDGATGTIGAIVKRGDDVCVLSNWHVLRDIGAGGVRQPGIVDGGGPGDVIGRVVDALRNMDGDAAIATLTNRHADPVIAGLSVAVINAEAPNDGDHVVMAGRSSGVVRGRVRLLHPAVLWRNDPPSGLVFQVACFSVEPLTGSSPLTTDGDSGGAWMRCDADGHPDGTMLGLHFGVATQSGNAVACFADRVFTALGITAARTPAGGLVPAPIPPAATGPAYRVVARTAPIRRFPTPDGAITGQRQFGDIVRVVGRYLDFYTVDIDGDGMADGYMFNDVLRQV